MLARFTPLTAVAVTLVFVMVLAACGPSPEAGEVAGATGKAQTQAQGEAQPHPTPTPVPMLTQGIPPCTPVEGSLVDPCEPGLTPAGAGEGAASSIIGDIGLDADGEPLLTLEDWLEGSASAAAHLVIRATYLPNTIRCSPDFGDYWFDYLEPSGGYGAGTPIIHCFADVRVNEYILGSGPTRLTLEVNFGIYGEGYDEDELWDVVTEWERVLTHSGEDPSYLNWRQSLPGREQVMFIGPSYNASLRSWTVHGDWDVERKEDGTVTAVHPWRGDFTAEQRAGNPTAFEMPLATLRTRIAAAQTARVTANDGRIQPGSEYPMLITKVDKLDEFYEDAGVTEQDDPPPPCGLAVADQLDHPGVMRDCLTLLGLKDELRGAGSLNWGTGTAIASWDGVTVAGTPQRVTKLKLANKSLTGTIPAALTKLTGLNELKLAGNTLTGCIPLKLKDVPSNDLASLNLLYCRPPAPGNVSAGAATETGIPLSWDAVSNASKYRVEYREGDRGDWTLAGDTLTGTTHTVARLRCGSEYQFRVGAYGSGTLYATAWSEPSTPVKASTAACTPPAFGSTSYSFSVTGDAAVGAAVGTVSAADAGGDAVTYSITAGHGDGKFAIDAGTGKITVAGDLSAAAGTSSTLTVEAVDESGDGDGDHRGDQGVLQRRRSAQSRRQPGPGGRLQDPAGPEERPGGHGVAELEHRRGDDHLGRRGSPRLAQPGREAKPAAEGADGQRPA